jgi:hypothetical protein
VLVLPGDHIHEHGKWLHHANAPARGCPS